MGLNSHNLKAFTWEIQPHLCLERSICCCEENKVQEATRKAETGHHSHLDRGCLGHREWDTKGAAGQRPTQVFQGLWPIGCVLMGECFNFLELSFLIYGVWMSPPPEGLLFITKLYGALLSSRVLDPLCLPVSWGLTKTMLPANPPRGGTWPLAGLLRVPSSESGKGQGLHACCGQLG